jgi:hypothetical protein
MKMHQDKHDKLLLFTHTFVCFFGCKIRICFEYTQTQMHTDVEITIRVQGYDGAWLGECFELAYFGDGLAAILAGNRCP